MRLNFIYAPTYRLACMSLTPGPNRGLPDLAAVEHSSICADTAPPCGSHAGTCRTIEWGVWPAERPVSPGTQQPPAPLVGTRLHQPHIAPCRGTMPHSGGRRSTPDELQHSQWWREGRERWVRRQATHLREDKIERG